MLLPFQAGAASHVPSKASAPRQPPPAPKEPRAWSNSRTAMPMDCNGPGDVLAYLLASFKRSNKISCTFRSLRLLPQSSPGSHLPLSTHIPEPPRTVSYPSKSGVYIQFPSKPSALSRGAAAFLWVCLWPSGTQGVTNVD
jgi:hypothetical protein